MRELPAEHNATVILNDDLTLSYTTDMINMVDTDNQTTRKLVSVKPNPDDKIVSIEDHPEHFNRLTSMNVSLTNACNLSCNYCYEQHNKDFGRFTVESIKQAYDFLNNVNNLADKTLIFFGGEPLIHKKLVLDFLSIYRDEIKETPIKITMISNGLLLDEKFINEYFSYSNTNIVLSIDTFNSAIDQRKIPQDRLDKLRETIKLIPKDRVTVRPTISYLTALSFKEFLDDLITLGVRSFIMQPLIMGNLDGFLDWNDDQWHQLTTLITNFLRENPTVAIEVTEGVGTKSMGNNCLSGYDIISIDPSGDFSGCFFFVNQKEAAGNLISGNIFQDRLYINRQEKFDAAYREMFVKYDQCKACDLQDHCYQCPAGNLDVSGQLFRPDSMCQRFVKFYLDINNEQFQIRFKRIMTRLLEDYKEMGQLAYRRQLLKYLNKEIEFSFEVEEIGFKTLKSVFWKTITKEEEMKERSMQEIFEKLKEIRGIQTRTVNSTRVANVDENLLYLTLMGVTVYEL